MTKELKSKSGNQVVMSGNAHEEPQTQYVGNSERFAYTQSLLDAKSDPNWAKRLQGLKNPGDIAVKVGTHENGSLNIMAAQKGVDGAITMYGDLTRNMISNFDVKTTACVGGKDADKKLAFIREAGIGTVGRSFDSIDGQHTEVKFDMDKLSQYDRDGVEYHQVVAPVREADVHAKMAAMMVTPSASRRMPSMADDLVLMEQHQNDSTGDYGS